jgi:hypothetical protein
MAPSNLSQVFVANDISDTTNGTIETGSTFYTTAAAVANTLIGVWDLGTSAYLATDLRSAKGPLQIVQTPLAGKNTIASPLFEAKDIKYIKYTPYVVSQRHTVAATFAATVPAGNTYLVKVAIRTAPTAYANYYQDNGVIDLSGAGKIFPLLGNFAAGRTLEQIVEIAAGTTVANCGIAVTSAINASPLLSSLFTVSDNGAGTVTVVARHAGVVFDLVAFNSTTDTNVIGTPTVTGWDAGSGNYWQALSDEKAQRAKYGNFNRMYFPQDFTQYAIAGNTYDVVEVAYAHNWPSSTGIAKAGELNVVKMYHKVTPAVNTVADALFGGYTVGTETYFTS